MKIKKIEYPTELSKIDKYNDNIDVFVETEDNQYFTMTVCTPKFYESYMDKEKIDFISAGSPDIIVKELTDEIIRKALEDYCKYNGYWMKAFYLIGEMSDEILNKELAKVSKINSFDVDDE